MSKKIVILGTGGTISGRAARADDHLGYAAGEVGIAEIVQGVPALAAWRIETQQVAQLDSKDMTHAVWQQLARRIQECLVDAAVQAVVVTHGTDTLEETALFIDKVLSPSKPVVFTCAMRPASALVPDGPQNLVDAVVVAATEGARGVCVVCAGEVHLANAVRKVDTYRLDAFSSGSEGMLGQVGPGGLRRAREWPAPIAARVKLLELAPERWPRVEIVASHAGASGRLVELLAADGVRGIVVAATGNGTLHAELDIALQRAMQAGIAVVRATRCALGRIYPVEGGIADAGALTPAQARVEMMIGLAG